MNTQAQKISSVAFDAIEHARYCTEQARWLNALACAIDNTLEGRSALLGARVSHARDLAGLACYLANDLCTYSETRARDMQNELDMAEKEDEQ